MERVERITRHLTAGSMLLPGDGMEGVERGPFLVGGGCSDVFSKAEKRQIERDGFIVVRGLVSKEELDRYKERFREISDGLVETTSLVMRDVALVKDEAGKRQRTQSSNVTKIQDFQDDPVLFQFCRNKSILKYVKAFCGENVRSIHTMLINKPPDLGKGTSRHPMHQDLYYFPLAPPERIVAAWVAMEKITRENGCLSVIPGSHRGRLQPHGYPRWQGGANFLYHGIMQQVDLGAREFLEVDIGDTVFFHPLLIHGSGRNSSSRFRKAISCHYASGTLTDFQLCEYQTSLISEGYDHYMKRHKLDENSIPDYLKFLGFKEYWKSKSRQIEGEEPAKWRPGVLED